MQKQFINSSAITNPHSTNSVSVKRTCRVCGETKPETLEFFPRKPGKGSVYLKRICRVCFAAKKKISDARSYALHRETRRARENARWEEKRADPAFRQKEQDRLHKLYLANKDEIK